jgi:mannosyltransferase OCH1-like enzyme
MIPWKFHFIWIQGFDVCPFKENYNHCQKLNPDVTFYFWDEPKILELFDTTPWIPNRDQVRELYLSEKVFAGKADIARYVIMYVYGGVYIDMDYQCIQSFAPILKTYGTKIDLVVVMTKDHWYYLKPILYGKSKSKNLNNGFFANKPQHDLLKYVLEYCIQNKDQKIIAFRTGTYNFYQSLEKVFQNGGKSKTLILPRMYYNPIEIFHCHSKKTNLSNMVMVHTNNFSYKPRWIRTILKVSPWVYLYSIFIAILIILFLVFIVTKNFIILYTLCSIVILFVIVYVLSRYYSNLFQPQFNPLQKTVVVKNENYDKLMVVAHPDDELLFGGLAILREPGWKVICITNDQANSE